MHLLNKCGLPPTPFTPWCSPASSPAALLQPDSKFSQLHKFQEQTGSVRYLELDTREGPTAGGGLAEAAGQPHSLEGDLPTLLSPTTLGEGGDFAPQELPSFPSTYKAEAPEGQAFRAQLKLILHTGKPWGSCSLGLAVSLFHGRIPCHCPCAVIRLHRELRHSSWVAQGQLTGGVQPITIWFPSWQESSPTSSQGDKEDLRICQSSVPGIHSLCCPHERTKYSPKLSFLSSRSTNPSLPPSPPSIPVAVPSHQCPQRDSLVSGWVRAMQPQRTRADLEELLPSPSSHSPGNRA